MITKLLRILVVGLILALLWWAAKLLIVALGAPLIIGTIVLVLFILVFCIFLAREFGVLGE